jgi:hypothetical protein
MTKNGLLDGTTETGEIGPRREEAGSARERWDGQRSFIPDNFTLGAIGMAIKH